jgi:hypothetical protein
MQHCTIPKYVSETLADEPVHFNDFHHRYISERAMHHRTATNRRFDRRFTTLQH